MDPECAGRLMRDGERDGRSAAEAGWGRWAGQEGVLVSNFGHRTSAFIVENFVFFPDHLQPQEIVMLPSVPKGE